MLKVFRDAVCQSPLEICPDKFVGIKLRCVSRKVKRVDSRMFSKEFMNEFGSVERASVPEKNDGAFEVTAKMPEELSDLSCSNVFVGIKPSVESKPLSLRRYCNGGDSGDLCPASGDNEDWGFSFDRPSSLDIWNKRESALIQEGQAGSKPSGLFLYAARRDVSSSESLAPGAPWPSSAVSGNSNPSRSSDSTNCRYNSALGNSSERSGRYASTSKDPSNNQLPRGPSLRRAPRIFSDSPTKDKAVPYLASASVLCGHSSCRFDTNAPLSLKKRLAPGLQSDTYGLVSTNGRPDASAFPVFGVCHGVSFDPPVYPIV